jgi:transglutaminase/protease-like cytokinesis protein 3
MSTTAPVESKAHAESKTDVHDNAGGLSGTGGNQLSSSATLKKVKNRPDTERSAEERERLRQRRATFSFSRMSSFWGWDAVQL